MYAQVQLMQALPLGVWTVQAWNPAATVDRTGVQPPSSVRAGNTHPGRGRGRAAKPLSLHKPLQTEGSLDRQVAQGAQTAIPNTLDGPGLSRPAASHEFITIRTEGPPPNQRGCVKPIETRT